MSYKLHLQECTESPTSQRQVIIKSKAKGAVGIKLACRQGSPFKKQHRIRNMQCRVVTQMPLM